MKHVGNEIFEILKQQKIEVKSLAEAINKSTSYTYQIKKQPSIDAQLLEDISIAIGVSPSYFFDDYEGGMQLVTPRAGQENSTGNSANEIILLKELLAEKERIIKILLEERERGNRGRIGANE